MMMKTALTLAALALLAGCGSKNPQAEATEDAQAVAMVKRMSREPFKPLLPSPITPDDVARYGLDKPGCAFSKQGQDNPLFIAGPDEGFLRVGSDLKRFAAKTESADLPGGARSAYIGLSNWVDIVRQPGEGGDSDTTWPARLMVHDAQERIAYSADGVMNCHR